MEHYIKSLPYELELTSRVFHEAARCFFEQHDYPISQDEFIILDCLYMYPDIIQIELAKLILKGRAHTGKFLRTLENKKLIERTPAKSGSKIIMKISITPKGHNVYKTVSESLDKHVSESVSKFEAEKIKEIITLLQSMRRATVEKFNIKFD